MKEQPHQRSVHEQADIAEQQPLAGDRQHVRDVDRVSHVAIKSSNYEMPRREDGRGCAEPLECKASERIEQDETSRDDQQNSNCAKEAKAEERRLKAPARDPPGQERGHRPRRNDEKDRGSQDRENSPHRALLDLNLETRWTAGLGAVGREFERSHWTPPFSLGCGCAAGGSISRSTETRTISICIGSPPGAEMVWSS